MNEVEVSMVPPDYVDQVWPNIEPYMEGAAKYTHGRYTADDVKDSILQYDHILWIAYDDTCIKGAVVTNVVHYPSKKCLSMVFTGGILLKTWKDPMLVILQKWAKEHECDVIESTGRPGWAKIFTNDGHKIVWHTYELPVEAGIGVENG